MASRTAFHPWTESAETPGLHTRSLATPEFMLSMLNEYALGHNCPYLGASISVQSPLTVPELETRLKQAFVHTRWVYPAVACQIRESKQMAYPVEDAELVEKWASRTAQTVEAAGGWLPLHEKLSRSVVLPSQDGDCAFIYAVVSPEEARKVQIGQFDLLLHVHHGLADGAGLRSMMNEVLVGLSSAGGTTSHIWGQEVDRLSPAALDVAIISEDVTKALAAMPKEIPLPPLEKPALEAARQGTGVVSHSFDDGDKGKGGFLSALLEVARAHDVKLTAVVQAALALAVYDAVGPTAEENCTVLSGFDLRARNLEEPWSQRNKFVGAAVGLEMMMIPVSALDETAGGAEGHFWAVARHMHGIWAAAAQRKDVAAANELRRGATGFIIKGVLDSIKAPTSGVSLSFNYVSDPAGSNQLDGTYGDEGSQTKLVLDRYQLVTDESTAKLSCRSHSWNNTLSLCISFNNDRHDKADVQDILDRWVKVIEEAL